MPKIEIFVCEWWPFWILPIKKFLKGAKLAPGWFSFRIAQRWRIHKKLHNSNKTCFSTKWPFGNWTKRLTAGFNKTTCLNFWNFQSALSSHNKTLYKWNVIIIEAPDYLVEFRVRRLWHTENMCFELLSRWARGGCKAHVSWKKMYPSRHYYVVLRDQCTHLISGQLF